MSFAGHVADMIRRDKENREARQRRREKNQEMRQKNLDMNIRYDVPDISLEEFEEINRLTKQREEEQQQYRFRMMSIALGVILILVLLFWAVIQLF